MCVTVMVTCAPVEDGVVSTDSRNEPRLILGPGIRVGDDLPDRPHVEAVVAVNPADPDDIVVASIVIQEPFSGDFHDSWTVHALVSGDGGASWIRRSLPGLDAAVSADPWLQWSRDGDLYLSVLAAADDDPLRTWLYESKDGGNEWAGPADVPFAYEGSVDHPVIDVAGERLFVFASGDLPAILVTRESASDGALEPLPDFRPDSLNNNLGAGIGFPDGRFVFSYFSMSVPQPSSLYAVRPNEEGDGHRVSTITPEHIPVGFPRLAVDRSTGTWRDRVYSVWTRSEQQPDVMIAHSDDFGASWSRPIRVQGDSSRSSRIQPAVHVNEDGTVAAAWIDGRRHEGDCWDVFAAVSLDGGRTFTPERRLTPEITCPNAPGNRNGQAARRWRWGGDYIGLASDSRGRFYVSWADSRTGVYQVYMRSIGIEPTEHRP